LRKEETVRWTSLKTNSLQVVLVARVYSHSVREDTER